MPDPQPVAAGDDGSDDAWAASDNDNASTPDPSGGYVLDGARYPGWRAGDTVSGQGLLGVAAPPEDQVAAQQAGAAVNQAFAMGYGRAARALPTSSNVSPPTANTSQKNPVGQGFSDGFVDDFKDLYRGALNQARIFALNPMIWAIRAVPGIDPTNTMARGLAANELNTVNTLNSAVRTNTVPYFAGNLAGHGAAKLVQSAILGAFGGEFAAGAEPDALEASEFATPEPETPPEPYSRLDHYGRTPTPADRKSMNLGSDQVANHVPPLVQRYYEGDPSIGEKPGWQMTDVERRQSASDRSRMKQQSAAESNAQGGQMSHYARRKKREHGF